jgi:hypothetical protein
MTETVWIVLIIAAVIVLLAFRQRLTNAAIEVVRGKKVKASMTAAQPVTETAGAGATGNLMAVANEIDTIQGAPVTSNTMAGKNKITVRPATGPAAQQPPRK